MDIVKYIVEILIEKDQVVIPGLGSFITEYNSAKIHPVDHTFSPPVKSIIFDELTTDDDLLTRRISEGENISLATADKEIKNFSDKILADIQKKKIAVIKGLGTFSINFENIITFTAAAINFSDESFGLTEFKSPAVVRNEYKDMAELKIVEQKKAEIERKKRNRTYLVYGAIAVVLLIFIFIYFLTNVPTIDEHKYNRKVVKDTPIQNSKPEIVTTQIVNNDSGDIKDQQTTEKNATDPPTKVEKDNTQKKIKTPDKTTSDVKYYIVAGSFKVEENANTRVAELKAKGYPNAGVVKHVKNDLFVAYYDVLTTKDKAAQEHKKINAELDKDAWIMKK